MSIVAKSIVLKRDSIEIVGADEYPVIGTRKIHKWSTPRTVEEERILARELTLGAIKPIPSCGNYFWWWIVQELRKRYSRESTDTEWSDAFREIWNEYVTRNNEPENTLVKIKFYGSPAYIKTYGRRVSSISKRELATPFTKYRAAYYADKYVAGETELQ